MIIPVDPDKYEYGDDFVQCYEINKTPKFVYAAFTGILRGDLWIPGDLDPPNDIFKLGQTLPGLWQGGVDGYTILYSLDPASTLLTIAGGPGGGIFFDWPNIGCEINFIADNQNPVGAKWYKGNCSIFWIEPPEFSAASASCDLFNIPKSDETTVLVYPVAPDQQVVKLQNFTENIKISIKRDFA